MRLPTVLSVRGPVRADGIRSPHRGNLDLVAREKRRGRLSGAERLMSGERCTVLTVEKQRVLARSLVASGGRPKHVLSVSNAGDALVVLRSVRLHVVIIDAEAEGIDVSAILTAIDEGLVRSRMKPLVIVGAAELPRGIARSEVTLLQKPISSTRLAEVVEAHFAAVCPMA